MPLIEFLAWSTLAVMVLLLAAIAIALFIVSPWIERHFTDDDYPGDDSEEFEDRT